MLLSLDERKADLINKILLASSREDVQIFSDAAIKALKQHEKHEDVIIRFADKMITELVLLSPMNKNAQQWSNITMARIIFNRFKYKEYRAAK